MSKESKKDTPEKAAPRKGLFQRKKDDGNNEKNDGRKDKKKQPVWKVISKIILWILAILAALILLVIIFLNPLLDFAVTVVGSSIIGAPVSVDKIELSISDGTFDITNLQVGNPENFSSPAMLKLGAFHISLDKDSLFSDEIIINDIEVHKLHVTAEVNQDGKMNFLTLIEGLQEKFPPSEEKTEPDAPAPKVLVKQFSLEDFKFTWIDARGEFNINGFGASLARLSGSLTGGNIDIESFAISNPDAYDISHMLKIASITVKIDPDTLQTPAPVIKCIEISGMQSQAEFSKSGGFNVLDVVESFQALVPAGEDDAEAADPAESDADAGVTGGEDAPAPQLDYFLLSNSSFSLRDDRIKIPVSIPLYVAKTDQTIIVNDTDILETMHEYAVWLRDQCTGVTDGSDLVLKFLGDTAGSGLKIIEETGKTGVKLLQNTNQSGQQVINDRINVFK